MVLFVMSAATLAALAAVGGAATGVLARRALSGVLVSAVVAVVTGGVVLLADPVAPWLPHRNVDAFLFGEAVYEGSAAAEVCTTTHARWVPLTAFSPEADRLSILEGGTETCTRDQRLSWGEATPHLGGLALLAWLVAAVAQRRRTPGPTTSAPGP